MKLLTFLKTLNEGFVDASIETAIPAAIDRLRDEIVYGLSSTEMAREMFNFYEYGDAYAEPTDSYEVVEEKYEAWLAEWTEARVHNAANEILDGMQHNSHAHLQGIVIHRVINAEEGFPANIASRGLGEYWSWEEGAAEAHWAGAGDPYHMVGLVDPKHVDWEQTLFQNAHLSFDHEREIYIPQGSPIELIKVLKGNGDEIQPALYGGRQMLQASKGLNEGRTINVPQHMKDMVVMRLLSELDEVAVQELYDQFESQYDDDDDGFGRSYDKDEAYNTWVKQWAKAKVESSLRDIAVLMEYEDGGINVYRAMKGDDNFMNNMKSRGLGTYWSWTRSGAVPYWGDLNNGGNTTYVIKGRVKPNAIDWDDTLFQNSHPTYHEELEATLKRGADVEVLEVYADGQVVDANPHKSYGMMTASVGESKVARGARFARLLELRDEDDAARLARAKAMGFDTSRIWYHGTNRSFDAFSKDVDPVFNNAQQYLGYFFTGDPKYAGGYTMGNDPEMTEYGGGNIVPVFLRAKKLKAEDLDFIDELEGNEMGGWTFEEVEEYKNDLIRQGYDGINFGNGYEIAIFDERNIRSIHAQFNDSGSDNLMASIGESVDDRLSRAEAMGFDTSTVWYHGTNADVHSFKGDYGVAAHLTRGADTASEWAAIASARSHNDNPTSVYPVFIRVKNVFDLRRHDHQVMIDFNEDEEDYNYHTLERYIPQIIAAGFDAYWDYEDANNLDNENNIAVVDAKNIRSIHAQFNDSNSDNLMASIGESMIEGPDTGHDMKLSGDDIQKHLIYFLMKAKEAGLGEPTILDTIGNYDVLSFPRSVHGDGQILFLMDVARPIIFVSLESHQADHNIRGVAVTDVRSTGEYPAAKFYYWILENINNVLFSDDQQTVHAGELWANLDRYYDDVEVTDEGDRFRAYLDQFHNESISESATGQYVYHATMAKNLGSIMKNGLTLFNDSLWVAAGNPNERYQDEPSVFAFEDPLAAFRWAHKIRWDYKEPAIVIKLKRGNTWEQDPSGQFMTSEGALKSTEAIPPSAIAGAMTLDQIGTPNSTGLFGEEFDQHVISMLESRGITEARSKLPAKLYHGTTVANVMEMLQDNVMNAGIHHGKSNEPDGPRLTKSYEVAKTFPPYSSYPKAVVEFVTARLASNYELVEYNDGVHGVDEQEVVVLAKAIEPLDKYVSVIHITRADAEALRHHGDEELEQMIGNLWSHPLVDIS